MGDIILGFILIIPLYAVLIWSYFYPKESMFGENGGCTMKSLKYRMVQFVI